MRIAMLAGRYPAWSEKFIARDAAALARRGHDVLIWPVAEVPRLARWHRVGPVPTEVEDGDDTPRPRHGSSRPNIVDSDIPGKDSPPPPFPDIIDGPLPPPPESRTPGARAGKIWRPLREAGWGQLRRAPTVLRALHCLPWTPDVVLAHFAGLPAVAGAALAAALDRPFAVFVHARDVWVPWAPGLRALGRARVIVACNRAARDELAARRPDLADRLVLCRHGLPPPAFRPAAPPDAAKPPLILAAGRLVEKKGFDTWLDALAILARDGRGFRAELIGEGPLRNSLTARAEAAGLPNWRCRPTLSAGEFAARLREATVFVHPARVGADGDRDGIPNGVLEALAAGVAVVAADAGGLSEVIGHLGKLLAAEGGEVEAEEREEGVVAGGLSDATTPTGWLTPSNDPSALAAALAAALDDSAERSRRRAAGRELARRRFSLSRTAPSLEAALTEIPQVASL